MRKTKAERFWEKVDQDGECWVWTATKNLQGYGRFKVAGVLHGAHRVSYEMANGEIPEGKQVNHTCGNRACVHPSHLYAGDQIQNMQDRLRDGHYENAEKTHCKRGHPFDEANTYWYTNQRIGRPRRSCRVCTNQWARERRARQRTTA